MSNDIFRQLTNGARFDLKKFGTDASAFHLTKDQQPLDDENDFETLKAQDRIHVIGEDLSDPIDSFEQMQKEYNLDEVFMENLKKAHFSRPTPVQMQAIPLMMDKRELICCSFTGSGEFGLTEFILSSSSNSNLNPLKPGKTLAFLLPVICKIQESKNRTSKKQKQTPSIKAVILAPTCELARQIYRECNWFAHGTQLSVCLINNVYKFENNSFDILITTPKRLVFLIEKKSLQLNRLEYLVIDECDRLFQHIFRQQLAIIYRACQESPNVSRALFSATFDRKLEKWFQLNLDNVVTLLIGDKLNVPKCIRQELKYVGNENGKFMAIKEIIAQGIQPPVLIFCQYKSSANVLYAKMRQEKYNVALLHSEVAEGKRSEIINQFRAGKIWFLICTELMGRGIDFKGVTCLVNYDYPPDPVTYIHRVGRTGRAGKPGRAITLFTHEEMEHPTKLRYIVSIMKKAGFEPGFNFEELAKLPTVKRKKKFYDEKGQVKSAKKPKTGRLVRSKEDGKPVKKPVDLKEKKLKAKKAKQRKLIRKKVLLKSRTLEEQPE